MSLEDALELVAERGKLMGALPRGGMLAVQEAEDDLAARLAAGYPALSVGAVNAPSSCVASGPLSEIGRLETELAAAEIAHRRVPTSHAFHSAMMDPILASFEERVRRVRLAAPSIPFLSNVTGSWISAEQAMSPAYWAGHVRQTVRFADNVAALVASGDRRLLEVGPGTALSSLARRQAGPEAVIVASLRHPSQEEGDDSAALEALGKLWCAGVAADWPAFHAGFARRRVPLPTYPFERQRYWIEPEEDTETGKTPDAATAKEPDLGRWFYVPGWKRSHPRSKPEEVEPDWLIFDDHSKTARCLADLAASRGAFVAKVDPGAGFEREAADRFRIDPRRREDYDRLVRELHEAGRSPARIVHLWCADGSRIEASDVLDRGFFSLLHLCQALGGSPGSRDVRIVAVAERLFDVTGEEVVRPERATLVGPCRVASQEYPEMSLRLLDAVEDPEGAARRIAGEMEDREGGRVAAWRGGHRWIPSYEKLVREPPGGEPEAIRPGGAYLLTGGTGPLELAIAGRLAAAGAKRIAFTQCGPEADAAVARLRATGVDVLCSPARADRRQEITSAVIAARERFGRLDAVFHTAGEIGGGMIQLKERDAAERVLAPRLDGARFLAGLLGPGETLALFSSAISATGVFGQVDYCAASAFLDAFAHSRRRLPGARVLALDWGTAHWDRWQAASGPGSEALLEQLREIQESVGITVEEGVESLWRALDLATPQVVVSPQDLDELIAVSSSSSVAEFLEGVGRPSPGAGVTGREIDELETSTQRRVAEIWSALLGVSPIGRKDSFFDLGGNSLLAIQLASHLRKAFDTDLTVASLFESPDLASLAAAVDASLEERRRAEEVARLLEEIEGLSEDQVRAELEQAAGA
jgi:malonyl CoA-acyl carrier protein transacylase